MKLLSPLHWKDYELIDSGDFEKLEKFGEYILIRPEPQAIWKKTLKNSKTKKVMYPKKFSALNKSNEKTRMVFFCSSKVYINKAQLNKKILI